MKTLFIECNMGAAGDMLMGALYELLTDAEKDSFLKTMNELFPDQIMLHAAASEKCGIWGTKMNVVILGKEEHRHRALTPCDRSQRSWRPFSHQLSRNAVTD